MKNIFSKITMISAILIFSSCDLLDIEPKNSLSSSVALSDANSFEAVLTSAYDKVQAFNYWGRDMSLMGDVLTDNIYVENLIAGGRYVSHNTNVVNNHYNTWLTSYSAINDLNNILEVIDARLTSPADVERKPQLKGEALFLRGMIYFDLARIYGYEPTQIPTTGAGKDFDKSVVLRLHPTLSPADGARTPRSTVEDIYDAIETDLLASIAIISKDDAETGKGPFRGNKGAAHALLGKVYLYWEKYAEAVTQFDLAMANTSAEPMVAGEYAAKFKSAPPHKEALFQLRFVQAVEMSGVVGVNNSPFSYTQPNGRANLSTYGGSTPSAELRALFLAGDDRLAIMSTANVPENGPLYNWCDKFNGSDGQYTDGPWVIRYADVQLMKAEALAEQGQFAAAQTIVNALRAARSTTEIAPGDATIIDFIMEERRRELFFEGHRWFDLKRKGMVITKPAGKGVALPYDDTRILAPIPTSEVTFNPGLPQNPGY